MQLKHPARGGQRGLSVVELMVGITIGLIVAAAATLVMSNQTIDTRRLLLETQLQQDLRAAADIVTRELRRAGADVENPSLNMVWYPGRPTEVWSNVYAETLTPAAGATANEVSFAYNPGDGGADVFGFKLEGGVLRTKLRAGGWQDLTDRSSMVVTQFSVTRSADSTAQVPCPKACADGTAACWPTVSVRSMAVSIRARSNQANEIERSILSHVRVRNDRVRFANGSTTQVCPP